MGPSDDGVGSGEDRRLVPVIGPADPERRLTFLTDLPDLTLAGRLVQHMPLDDQVVANLCSHGFLRSEPDPIVVSGERRR